MRSKFIFYTNCLLTRQYIQQLLSIIAVALVVEFIITLIDIGFVAAS
jgi:hypothetical protein